jgi:hypothetical protein
MWGFSVCVAHAKPPYVPIFPAKPVEPVFFKRMYSSKFGFRLYGFVLVKGASGVGITVTGNSVD